MGADLRRRAGEQGNRNIAGRFNLFDTTIQLTRNYQTTPHKKMIHFTGKGPLYEFVNNGRIHLVGIN